MKVEIRDGEGRVRGTVTLSVDGTAVFDEGASWIADLSISGPRGEVHPSDGPAYLEALPGNFRTPYRRAVLIQD